MEECCLIYYILPLYLIAFIVMWYFFLSQLLSVFLPLSLPVFLHPHSLSNQPASVDIITEHQMMAEALAKKEIAQKKLAVSYFSLIMGLEIEQHQHTSYHK